MRTTFNPDQYNQTINDRNQEIQSNVNVEKTLQVATKEMGDYENIITENKKKNLYQVDDKSNIGIFKNGSHSIH